MKSKTLQAKFSKSKGNEKRPKVFDSSLYSNFESHIGRKYLEILYQKSLSLYMYIRITVFEHVSSDLESHSPRTQILRYSVVHVI